MQARMMWIPLFRWIHESCRGLAGNRGLLPGEAILSSKDWWVRLYAACNSIHDTTFLTIGHPERSTSRPRFLELTGESRGGLLYDSVAQALLPVLVSCSRILRHRPGVSLPQKKGLRNENAKGQKMHFYRRNLPHIEAFDATYFVTFRVWRYPYLPPAARSIAMRHCLFENGRKIELHVCDHAQPTFIFCLLLWKTKVVIRFLLLRS